MPLPIGGDTRWPPREWEQAYAHMAEWAAWFSADPWQLAYWYGGVGSPSLPANASGFYGTQISSESPPGSAPFWRRFMWWGKRSSDPPTRNRIHVPLASDIAQTSADLLFSEAPSFTIPAAREVKAPPESKAIQDRLNDLVDACGIDQTLIEAAEIAAALSGVYLRVCWDQEVAPDHPLLTAVHPDAAVPEFRYGYLTAVTFWSCMREDGQKIYRHLERHESGHILHGLYEGTRQELGRRIALSSLPETAALLAGYDLESQATSVEADISTGIDGLTAVYVPNQRPNREDRRSPLGRSDYAGVEGMMDALDEAMTSWMREIRLCRARVMVPETWLRTLGKGQGASFDVDQEIFTALDMLEGDLSEPKFIQPSIRTAEHLATTTELIQLIVQTAGYSPASFGLKGEGNVITATEVGARERRSLVTRAKKASYWTRPLIEILTRLLEIDALVFGGPGADRPSVEFADSVQPDIAKEASAYQMLRSAELISIETGVRERNPDWDDEQVTAEVARIKDDSGRSVPDLTSVGAGAFGLPEPALVPPNGQPGQPNGQPPNGQQPAEAGAQGSPQ